jgi:penicillin-binding protein 2
MYLPPSPPKPEPEPERGPLLVRAAMLGVVAAVLFGVLLFRLWALQVLHSDQYVAEAISNDVRSAAIPAPRGVVFDRDGKVLVTNASGVAAQVNPVVLRTGVDCGDLRRPGRRADCRRLVRKFADERDPSCRRIPYQRDCRVLSRLARVLGLGERRVWREYERALRVNPNEPVEIDGSVTKRQIAYVRERRARFPGVEFRETYQRDYPFGALAPNVLGNVNRIDPEDLRDPLFDGLAADAIVGKAGVEYVYDRELRGVDGEQQQSYDATGQPVGHAYQVRAPVVGDSLRLSLDVRLQRVAQEAIRYGIEVAHGDGQWDADSGAIVAMNPRTGAIYALASYPTYDPSIWVPPYRGQERVLKQKANPPLYDRATAGDYPPGSTFKPFTASAARMAGVLSPGEPLVCSPSYEHPGDTSNTVFNNWTSLYNTPMSLATALEVSCNTFFFRIGDEFWSRQNEDFQSWLRRFGFGAPPPIDVLGAGAGLVPDDDWKATYEPFVTAPNAALQTLWLPCDSINMSIGQGFLRVSPLQMAVGYSAIANGGTVVTPHVGAAVVDADNHVKRALEHPPQRRLSLPDDLVAEVRDGLIRASHSPNGTSTSVFGSFDPVVAGKTGTAQAPPKDDHAWYAAWAPADDPELVVVALIEHGGHGGVSAAPAALRVFQAYFHPGQPLPSKVGVDVSR